MSTPLRHGCADHISNPQEDCEYCKASNRVLEAARPSEGSVTCSDLICELEAALKEMEGLDDGYWDGAAKVQSTIKKALEKERGRSQISVLPKQ